VGGSYSSQEARETVQMVERNGLRFAFLAYSSIDNTYADQKDEPNSYYAVPFDKDAAAADIARAKQVADCVIVSMHWGDEYTAEPNSSQKEQAQWLADQDVDLVVGTHAHNIQPVEYYTSSSGTRIPVVFGLSDFVSGWTLTDTILSGIFTCDFVRQDNGRVTVQNPKWHPTIEWSDGEGATYVRMLENMSVSEINANTRAEDFPGESFVHVYDLTNQTINKIPVEWGKDAADKEKAAKGDTSSDETADSSSAAGTSGGNAAGVAAGAAGAAAAGAGAAALANGTDDEDADATDSETAAEDADSTTDDETASDNADSTTYDESTEGETADYTSADEADDGTGYAEDSDASSEGDATGDGQE
jgi:hypothetical protein